MGVETRVTYIPLVILCTFDSKAVRASASKNPSTEVEFDIPVGAVVRVFGLLPTTEVGKS